jgi:hypothetical protein
MIFESPIVIRSETMIHIKIILFTYLLQIFKSVKCNQEPIEKIRVKDCSRALVYKTRAV